MENDDFAFSCPSLWGLRGNVRWPS